MGSVFCGRRIAYVLVPLVLLVGIGLVVYFVGIKGNESEDSPEVTIPQGTLRGLNMVTRNNRNFYGFIGIPFVEPPLGNLRFEAPVAAGPWNGTLDATKDSSQCPQITPVSGVITGDEDCLYLHVYTPRLPTNENSTLLPVMMFIHGGAFRLESNNPERYGPYFLLDKDVVLVVPSYRLGIFGFLSTGDEVVPGNNGLKDMVKALEWNRDNIKYFGGDPNQVTIFGESGGAMSVHLLALSNQSSGLFHKFITQSGSGLAMGLQKPKTVLADRTIQLAEHFGCPTSTSIALVNCLRGFNTTQFMSSGFSFNPTIEPDIEGAFITDKPENLFANGNIQGKPSLSLVNQNEGILSARQYFTNPDLLETFLNDMDTALPSMFGYDVLVDDVPAFTAAIKSYFFNDVTANRSSLLYNMTLIQHDAVVGYPTYRAIHKQVDYTNNIQYVCTFEYLGTFSSTYQISSGAEDGYGSTHMDELLYLFRQELSSSNSASGTDTEMSEADWKIVDTMVELWTSFAINGKPTTGDPNTNDIWEPYTSQKNYLRIGNYSDTSLEVEYNYFGERAQFWEELYANATWNEI